MLDQQVELSVVIKALNESLNIERTIRSILAATRGLNCEVILADSCSTDETIEIAGKFPIRIVQLSLANERCCGIGAQLGYQFASGEFILVVDGDMQIEREWLLDALDLLRNNSEVGGVGGVVKEMNLGNIEFRARQARQPKDMQPGIVDRLNMGGLYRSLAIENVGYLTHRGLHACEELELGLRLTFSGWKLIRLSKISILHYGHSVPLFSLMKRRWSSRYVNGAGELLKYSVGKPWFFAACKAVKLPLIVLFWMACCLVLLCVSLIFPIKELVLFVLLLFIAPMLALSVKKKSFNMAAYSFMALCFDAFGFARGFFTAQRTDPVDRIAAIEIAKVY